MIDLSEFEEPELVCDYEGCTSRAAWMMLCGICRSGECICEVHYQETRGYDGVIFFSESCKHRVDIADCLFESLGVEP